MAVTSTPVTVDMSDFPAAGFAYDDAFAQVAHSNVIVTGKELAQIQRAAIDGRNYALQSQAGVNGLQSGARSGLSAVAALVQQYSSENLLINPFSISQRTTPTAAATIADGGFGPDRWKSYRENADIQYRRYRRGDAGSDFTNTRALAYARYSKITNNGKIMVLQQLESAASYPMIGQPIKKTIKLRANLARSYRLLFIEWSGTEDTITGTISAWGAAGTIPTFTSGSYVIAKQRSVVVDTQFREFSLEYTPSSTVKNIAVVILSDGLLTGGTDYLEMAEPLLWASQSVQRIWTPRQLQQELALSQRYFWKTFRPSIAPVQNAGIADLGLISVGQVGAAAATAVQFYMRWAVQMRGLPVVVTYNPAATNAQIRNATTASDFTGTTVDYISEDGCRVYGTTPGGSAAAQSVYLHMTAESEL